MRKLSITTTIIITTIILGVLIVNNGRIVASKPAISLNETSAKTLVIPDTVYSKTVTSNVLLNGNTVPGANISYTLIDTINNTQELIREAITNTTGQDIVDSLPVLKHYTGIKDIVPLAYNELVITNNGTGSDHLIRFSTSAKSVSKEAQIINMLGQVVNKIPLKYNASTKSYDAVWNGQKEIGGTYIFQAQTTNGSVASKISHVAHSPSLIDNNAVLKTTNQNKTTFKNGLGDEDAKVLLRNKLTKASEVILRDNKAKNTGIAVATTRLFNEVSVQKSKLEWSSNLLTMPMSKYAINITHESLEDYIDTVLVQENSFHDFFFNTIGIQYANGNVFGNILFTESGNAPTNANVEYKQFNNQSTIFNTTAPNGMYNLQVPIIYEQNNPGQTKYIITLTENGDPFETLIDTLLVSPEINNFTHYLTQINPPPDTVYSDIITSTVLLNGTGFDGANITYTLLDSITGNQELIREAITNASGQDIVDSLPVLPAENGLGQGISQYIININHDNLEDLIDTVRVQENTTHNFAFNVTGMQYADGDVNGWIEFSNLTGAPSNAYIEYKQLLNQSEVFTTTAPNGVYNIQVPVIFEPLNPEQTKYIVTISENGDPFETLIDTLLISPGSNIFQHYVNQILPPDPEQDFEGIVRNVYSKLPESGVTVRLIDRALGTLLQEEITGVDGSYFFSNIAQGTLVEFELGKPGELWMVNNEFDVPASIVDTVATLNRYFYPKTVEVPQLGANTNIESEGVEIAEMVGSDRINFEEILRDVDNVWDNGGASDYWSARTFIQDNFYEGTSPITTVSTQRDITNTMQDTYDPYTNFYSGSLGWNANFGSGNTTSPLISATPYGVMAVIGGEMMMTSAGDIAPLIKELQGRRLQLGSVSSRESMMNASASMPTEKDRAYVYVQLINQDGRFDTQEESYSLRNITSTAPIMRSNEGQNIYGKEKPLPSIDYVDMKGSKPHSKNYFNNALSDLQSESNNSRF